MCNGNCNSSCVGGSCELSRLNAENIDLQIFRNRSEMEGQIVLKDTGELIDRIPVSFKSRENKLDYLSVSKIKAYDDCPSCFYDQYMSDSGIEEDNGNFFTKFGSILHKVVERASLYYAQSGIIIDPMSIYDEVWKEEELTGFGSYVEGKELIRDHFSRNPVEKRQDYAICIEHEWRGEIVHGIVFGLMIDYAGIMKTNPKIGTIKDYKTNRMPFTPAELDESFQLRTYEYVMRKFIRPDVEQWITGYEMFRYGWQPCPPRTESDLEDAISYIKDTHHQITHDNTWTPKLNNYCGFRKCRLTCKLYNDYISNPKRYIDEVLTDVSDLSQINKSMELLKTYEKIAKTRKEECATILKQHVENCAMIGKKCIIDGQELQLYSNATDSYRYYDTRNVLLANNELDCLDECLSISKSKMDKVLASKPYLKLVLSQCATTNYATPYIIKKKSK